MTMDEMIGKEYRGYVVKQVLGSGRFSTVYELQDPIPGAPSHAWKVYNDRHELAAQEAAALSKLDHRNVIKMYHHDGSTLVLEKADKSLRQEMQQYAVGSNERRTWALDRAKQMLHGLAHAHDKGIIHKDLKPENTLVLEDVVKLTDFNLSKDTNESRVAMSGAASLGSMVGSPSYRAPEGSKDKPSDVYSVGVVLYELLTGELPVGRYPNASGVSKADEWIDEVINKALEHDPKKRYADAGRMLVAMDNLQENFGKPKLTDRVKTAASWTKEKVNAGIVGLVKYTLGLPWVLGGKYDDKRGHAYGSKMATGGCLAVLAYFAMAVATPFALNKIADQRFAEALQRDKPAGAVVWYNTSTHRVEYVKGSDLGSSEVNVRTVVKELPGVGDIAPSADGKHVYVLSHVGPDSFLQLLDIETGTLADLVGKVQARQQLNNCAKLATVVKDSVEHVYLNKGNDWFELQDGALIPVGIISASTGQKPQSSADGRYKAAFQNYDWGELQVEPRGSWFADYSLGHDSANVSNAFWLSGQEGVKLPEAAKEIEPLPQPSRMGHPQPAQLPGYIYGPDGDVKPKSESEKPVDIMEAK
ncbi:serine/threonine protein kinase [Candidatus Woesearchaeota archaeon]|nr:serine/threonine protein kinase [Candidatus Woesearchaeota archaeon]